MPLAPNQRPVAVNMHERLRLALLLLAVPHTASLSTPVLETVALRGAASSSLRVAEGQADTIDSGAYTVSATIHPHVGAYAPVGTRRHVPADQGALEHGASPRRSRNPSAKLAARTRASAR